MIKSLLYITGLLIGFLIVWVSSDYLTYTEKFANSESKIKKAKTVETPRAPKKLDETNNKSKLDKNDSKVNSMATQATQATQAIESAIRISPKSDTATTSLVSSYAKADTVMECGTNLSTLPSGSTILDNSALVFLISVYDENKLQEKIWAPINSVVHDTIKFVSNGIIRRETFALNPYVKGAILDTTQLTGPQAKQALKDDIKNFSILFMLKIKDLTLKFNSIFNIKCKPTYVKNATTGIDMPYSNDIYIRIVENSAKESTSEKCNDNKACKELQSKLNEKINLYNSFYYFDKEKMKTEMDAIKTCNNDPECKEAFSTINEKMVFFNQLVDTKYHNIEIKVGTEVFVVHNINKMLFEDDFTLLGLIVKDKQVSVYLNTSIYNFTLKDSAKLALSEDEIIVNKDANTAMTLFSFAYYNDAVCANAVNIFKMYNYYYMFGSNKINDEKITFVNANKELKKQLDVK